LWNPEADEPSAVRSGNQGEDLLDLSVPIDVTGLPPLPQVQSNISMYSTVLFTVLDPRKDGQWNNFFKYLYTKIKIVKTFGKLSISRMFLSKTTATVYL
jgi:hypothetical protein